MEPGHTLSSEEHGPLALIDAAARTEGLGYSFASISDNSHPWVDAQGQSPFVWWTLGGIAHATTSLDIVHEVWPTSGLAGQLSQELPSPALFEQAWATVRREDVARSVIRGADVDPIVTALDEYRRAGFTRVHLHQIGHDQEPFFEAGQGELGDECRRRYR